MKADPLLRQGPAMPAGMHQLPLSLDDGGTSMPHS